MKASRLEIIGSAAAGIAHDINNQLNLIVNHLSVHDRAPLDNAAADLTAAKRAAVQCSALTTRLLAFCKGDSVAPAPLNPAAFLRSFAADLHLPAGIDFDLKIPRSLPPVSADALALTRILTNLTANACEAMEDGGTLRIEASPLAIEVADSGSGIPEDRLGKIFEPFFTTKGGSGTGLGLFIVRDLMRKQGGAVAVDSKPGQGTRFRLRFRAA